MHFVWRFFALAGALLAFACPAATAAKCPDPAKPQKKDLPVGSSTYSAYPPLGTATPKDPIILCFAIPDPANPKKTKIVEVPVPDANGKNIDKWDPTKETDVQASARKAAAIKAAVEVAIKAGDLPGVTVDTKQLQVPRIVRNPNPPPPLIVQLVPGYTAVTYGGVTRQSVSVKTDPTKQSGGGLNFMPGQPSPGSSSMGYKATMCGPGSKEVSTGLDPSGGQSMVGFGFYDTSTSPPTPFISAISPTPGETDAQVFSELAQAFNATFGSQGYHATYDPATDTLSLDKSLPLNDTFFFGNSDTGLDLCEHMDPAPLFLQCPSAAGLAGANVLIAINEDGSVSVKGTPLPPYDGIDDNLVCVANLSSDPVYSLSLSSPDGIFGFDGDGICDFAHLPGCPFGSSGDEGPGVSFSDISASANTGTVNFPAGLAPGSGAYFSLEAPFLGTAYLTEGSTEAAFTSVFGGPDNMKLSLETTPAVGLQNSIQTEILVNTVPVPNQDVVFSIVSGKAHLLNGDPGSGGLMSTVTTDDLGLTKAPFVIDAPGDVVIQAAIPGSTFGGTLKLTVGATAVKENQ